MRVTYIDHSGFFLEGEQTCLLFDYYQGPLPAPAKGKRLNIFASHHHPDHYVAEIFRYGEGVPETRYFLGSDITLNARNRQMMGIDDAIFQRCRRMHRDDQLRENGVSVRALRSTDMGAAFCVECEGKHIYHAGDHNLWIWREDPSFDRAQIERFYFEIEKLRGWRIDAAFLPLDPRLGEEYWRGFDAFARLLEPRFLFPMHMVGDGSIIDRLRENEISRPYRERIAQIRAAGDVFEI